MYYEVVEEFAMSLDENFVRKLAEKFVKQAESRINIILLLYESLRFIEKFCQIIVFIIQYVNNWLFCKLFF